MFVAVTFPPHNQNEIPILSAVENSFLLYFTVGVQVLGNGGKIVRCRSLIVGCLGLMAIALTSAKVLSSSSSASREEPICGL